MSLHNDYSQGKKIAHDWIRWPCVRVSTASYPSYLNGAPFGRLIETWIFSNCPNQQSHQVFHKTEQRAIKAHKHIVKNLKEKAANF